MFWWTDPLPFGLMIFRAFVQFFASLWMLATKNTISKKCCALKNELVVFPPTKSNDRNPAKGELNCVTVIQQLTIRRDLIHLQGGIYRKR